MVDDRHERQRRCDIGDTGATLTSGDERRDGRIAYIAHEMGHYCFKAFASPEGPYVWFHAGIDGAIPVDRGLADARWRCGCSGHIAGLMAKANNQTEPFEALDRITDSFSIGGACRRSYVPLFLLAFERQVDKPKMRAFVRGLRSAGTIRTWSDLQTAAADAGIDRAFWGRWRYTCVADGRRTCQQRISPMGFPGKA